MMRMFGKIMAAAFCLMLLLCCVPAVLAAGHTADCPHCDETVTWTAWDGTSNITKAGHYYLPEGVAAMTAYRKIGTNDADRFDVVLDLNGQELTISKSAKMFQVVNGDKLVLFDSSEEQTGGLTGRGVATSHAGIIQAYGGSVEIYNGTYRLADGYQTTKEGGLIYSSFNNGNYPRITIHGGTFYGATGAVSGGVLTGNNSIVTIDGGVFHTGKASSAGDTIYMKKEWAQLHITGNPVIEGGIQIGGGDDAIQEVTIQGKPLIQKAEGGSTYGIKMPTGKVIKLGALEEGAKISISGTGVVAQGFDSPVAADQAAKTFFSADETGKVVKAKGQKLVVTENSVETTFDCPHCDEAVTWNVWDGAAALTAGHYYLEKDTQMTASGILEFSDNTAVVLNLNGYTLSKPEAGRMFRLQGKTKLVVMDSSADATGTMIGNSVNNHGMLIMTYDADASAEICGGNFLVQNPELKTRSGALVYASKGIIEITGGEFFGAAAEKGGVIATASAGALEITGGIFHAGTADKGDTMYVASESTVTIGGTARFDGGMEISTEADVTISGTPVIYKLAGGSAYSLKTATPITVGTLAEGAKIAVTAVPEQTVFTAELADEAAAKAALLFFSSDDNNKLIKAEGKALSCVACEAAPASSEDKAQLNAHYVGTTAYHGEMHDHSNSGGRSDGNSTLDVWKAQMAELGMDFATLVDHKQASHMRHALWDNTVFVGGSEAQTKLTTLPEGMGTMHFNMIFSRPEQLEVVAYKFYDYDGVDFEYINFSRTQMEEIVKTVKENGGLFVHVHPKSSKYIKSDDPLDYWYGNDTGLEVFYSLNNYTMNTSVNRKNYKLWTDLLALGKRVWATAGRDQHTVPGVNSLTTVYAEQKHADSFVEHMRVGDFTAGAVGIRMSIGDVKGGAQTIFQEGDRLVLSVGDFHECLDATHTYRLDLFDDQGQIYHQEISATEQNWFAFDVDPTVKFYRAEVYNVTDQVQIAFGQPIWNSTFQEEEPEDPEPTGETCPHCGLAVEWTAWDGTTALAANSHLYIPEEGVSISSYVGLDKSHVVIDLRGHAITSGTQPFRIRAGADAYFIDSVGGGTVTAKGSSSRHGGIFQFIGAGKLTITGGTYALSADEVFGESGYNGGLIYMGTVGGELNITGGTFHPTSAKGGGSIFATGAANTITIGGTAVINGGVQIEKTASVTLTGSPVIQKVQDGSAYSLKNVSGKLLTVKALQTGASIGITAADGVFTNELADENTALASAAFFTADDAAKVIIADGKALKITDMPEEQVIRGDMNGDDQVTDADALYLLRHTLFSDRYPIDQPGDVNGDGQVTDADALYLLRFTLFPERYPLN